MQADTTKENKEQKLQRKRAEADNVRQLQDTLTDRTRVLSRIRSPRRSLITGNISSGVSL